MPRTRIRRGLKKKMLAGGKNHRNQRFPPEVLEEWNSKFKTIGFFIGVIGSDIILDEVYVRWSIETITVDEMNRKLILFFEEN